MKQFSILVLAVAMTMAMSTTAAAAKFDMDKFYLGGGFAVNALSDYDEATGLQFFAGYDLEVEFGPIKNAVEAGFMDSGTFKSSAGDKSFFGLWASFVGFYPVHDKIDLLARVGFDFGDDDGVLLGAGAGFELNKNMQLRAEYVGRSDTKSYQVNFVYHF